MIRRVYENGEWIAAKWQTVRGKGGSIGVRSVKKISTQDEPPRLKLLFECDPEERQDREADMERRLGV